MKQVAIIIFSFLAGVFAPISITLPKQLAVSKSAQSTLPPIDPIALLFISVGLLGIFLLFKKRNRNRRG
jgi:hypothetical protein